MRFTKAKMKEEQFNRLPSQGNIYSTTRLGSVTIVGTGNYGKVFALTSKTTLEEVPLSELPCDIDIVALDSFQDTYPVLGVTYVQNNIIKGLEEVTNSYLQIYSTWNHSNLDSPTSTTSSGSSRSSSSSSSPKGGLRPQEEFNVTQVRHIGQTCNTIRLSYIPYHLYHCMVQRANGTYGTVFLLSGSDNKIHTYEGNDSQMTFFEVPTRNYFPELGGTFDSIVTRIQIECVNELSKRITMCGCEDGILKAFIISGVGTPTWTIPSTTAPDEVFTDDKLEGSLTTSEDDMIFGDSTTLEKITNYFDGIITSIQFFIDGFSVNAVVASSLTPTYVYSNIVEESFKSGGCLKFSSRWDSVNTICVADVDFDGRAEIIIGTFGCSVIVYKFMDAIQQWVVVCYKQFPSAIFSIEFHESILQVVSASGVHLLKYTTPPYFRILKDESDVSQISLSSMEEPNLQGKDSEFMYSFSNNPDSASAYSFPTPEVQPVSSSPNVEVESALSAGTPETHLS